MGSFNSRQSSSHQQTYSLDNATALVEGQEYHVTVQAFYAKYYLSIMSGITCCIAQN